MTGRSKTHPMLLEVTTTSLKSLRQKLGASKCQMAQQVGTCYNAYVAYEEGRSVPSLPTLVTLRQLGLSVDQLIDEYLQNATRG